MPASPRNRVAAPIVALLLLGGGAPAGPPSDVKSKDPYERRRAAAALALGRDYGLYFGQRLTDVLAVRQDRSFLYLTGVEEFEVAVLLCGKDAPRLKASRDAEEASAGSLLLVRRASDRRRLFHGWTLRPDAESARRVGLDGAREFVRGAEGIARVLARALPPGARLRVPAYRRPDDALLRQRRDEVERRLREARKDVRILEPGSFLERLRAVKDTEERRRIRVACERTVAAFNDVRPTIRPGGTEAEVDGALLAAIRKRNDRPAYGFIVAAGRHSAIPHYFRNDGPLRAGDLLVIDAGVSHRGYAADVTRTVPVSGTFTPRQRKLYLAVLAAQRAALREVRPGSDFRRIDRAARLVLAKAGLANHFIHGTCHHVGLDVHDPGPPRLEEGMTIAVEPGIYIEDEGIGIRIEDVVLVTADGHHNLTAALPREPDAVQRWWAAGKRSR